ncbi:MAG TPA: HRDC domain-containing protein [Ilumatobacteraceae bacterium]|nr:HRDC domain-containing protein [Ilumatobacteraceae bacterium]
MSHRWIDDQGEFDALIARLCTEPRYAMDTEFHRERTYFPQLALLQLATPTEGLVLVDPLPLDLSGLRQLFASPALAVVHAAQQDLDVLTHACGAVPAHLYDTQLAAGFVGYGTPSLVSLLQGELKVSAAKGDRLTDWLRRPLTDAQRDYAAADVAHLLQLHDVLVAQTDALGRSEWVAEACEELRTRPVSGTSPDEAWLRLKDVKNLRPKARGVAKALAAWRERRAMELNIPVRQVLPDLAILGIAQRAPSTVGELSSARGVDERHSRGTNAQQILSAVAVGREQETEMRTYDVDDLDRTLRPAVTLVSAWVSELARRQKVDNTLLATRSDLVALIRGDANARLRSGWRAEMLGDQVEQLLQGNAGLTFDREQGLRLIALGS